MNPNSPRPGHLFFTPRTPWGTRAGQQSFRQHQRASEDKKPDPASKQMQGLGGQMAPNQLTGSSGQPAQTGGSSAWKVPHTDLQPYQPQPVPQRPAPTAQQLATQPPLASTQQQWRSAQPVTLPQDEGDDARHWSGSAGSRGGRHPKDEPDDAHVELHYDTNPKVREAEERRRQEDKKISPKNPWEEEEQQDDR